MHKTFSRIDIWEKEINWKRSTFFVVVLFGSTHFSSDCIRMRSLLHCYIERRRRSEKSENCFYTGGLIFVLCNWFIKPMRPKARVLAQYGGRLAGWRRLTRAGVILYVMDGLYRLPFPYRTGCPNRSCPAASWLNFQLPLHRKLFTLIRHELHQATFSLYKTAGVWSMKLEDQVQQNELKLGIRNWRVKKRWIGSGGGGE